MTEVFRTSPLLVQKVWGGRKLETLFGKSLPDGQPYGESWEVADIAEGSSGVATGKDAGASLSELVDRYGAALVGDAAPDGRFPLLVKLLDAREDLSVQVHPGPEHAGRRPGARSKDECWVILDAERDAAIVHGFRQTTDEQVFAEAVEEGRVLDLLRRVPVRPGEAYRIAPGTVHAICAGVALLEIQQPSDTTYRVFDYDRPGLDGKPRELHVDDAVAVACLEETLPDQRGPAERDPQLQWSVVASVDAYRVEKLEPTAQVSWEISPHTAQVVHVVRGTCLLDDVELGPGQTAVIPAAQGRVWLTRPQTCELVVAGLGGARLIAAPR